MSEYEHAHHCEKNLDPVSGSCTCAGSVRIDIEADYQASDLQYRESSDALVIWRDDLLSDLGGAIDDPAFIEQAKVIIDKWLAKVRADLQKAEDEWTDKILNGDPDAAPGIFAGLTERQEPHSWHARPDTLQISMPDAMCAKCPDPISRHTITGSRSGKIRSFCNAIGCDCDGDFAAKNITITEVHPGGGYRIEAKGKAPDPKPPAPVIRFELGSDAPRILCADVACRHLVSGHMYIDGKRKDCMTAGCRCIEFRS